MISIRSFLKNRKAKTIVFSVLTVMYLAGLIAMFFSLQLGVLLWAAAFIPSLAVFLLQKQVEQDDEIEKAKEEALNAENEENTEA